MNKELNLPKEVMDMVVNDFSDSLKKFINDNMEELKNVYAIGHRAIIISMDDEGVDIGFEEKCSYKKVGQFEKDQSNVH